MTKKLTWGRVIFLVVLLSLVGSAVYSLLAFLSASAGPYPGDGKEPLRSDYLLKLAQCLIGIVVMFLPSLIERKLHIAIPGRMYIIYIVFLYAAIYLGEVQSFYNHVPSWDLVLHACSGIMLGALGFALVSLLNEADRVRISLSPLFVAVFAFCFALALGVIWEIYEFVMDSLFGLNMQRFADPGGRQLVGNEALVDTMTDLGLDFAGALITSVTGYFSLRKGKTWLDRIALRRVSPAPRK